MRNRDADAERADLSARRGIELDGAANIRGSFYLTAAWVAIAAF